MKPNKTFRLSPRQIERLLPNLGACFATDRITVHGERVGYMVREDPSGPEDSGWVFLAGTEEQAYLDEPSNTTIFEVNTLANYEPEIIQFLSYPVGTQIERNLSGRLEVLNPPPEPPAVVFLPPAGPGRLQLAQEWSIVLACQMLRRFHSGSLVLWRPGFTMWINVYSSANAQPARERLAEIEARASSRATERQRSERDGVLRFRYFLVEEDDSGKVQDVCFCFALLEGRQLHLAIYFDDVTHRVEIEYIWESIRGE